MSWKEKCPDCIQDEKNIKGFFGDYRFLSNFHVCDIEYEGIIYPSTEAAYQAAKSLDREQRLKFQKYTPSSSKNAGQLVTLRDDWENIKERVMYDVCYYKFSHYKELRDKLLDTGDRYLEETNWWRDRYWGVYKGEGLNRLGTILMTIRENLKNQTHGT